MDRFDRYYWWLGKIATAAAQLEFDLHMMISIRLKPQEEADVILNELDVRQLRKVIQSLYGREVKPLMDEVEEVFKKRNRLLHSFVGVVTQSGTPGLEAADEVHASRKDHRETPRRIMTDDQLDELHEEFTLLGGRLMGFVAKSNRKS